MVTGGKRRLPILVLLVAAALPAAAHGQVAAPRLVEDGDAPAEEERPPRPVAREPARETPRAAPSPPAAAQPAPGPAAPLPPPPPPPTAATDLARRIVPVQAKHSRLRELWTERRAAEREADPSRADAAGKALLAVKSELAIQDLVPYAVAEIRQSRRALRSNQPAEAVARASFAVALAPAFPEGHFALARARLSANPAGIGAVLGALRDGLAAAAREPHTVRAFLGDVTSAGFAAAFVASLATIFLLVVRRFRPFFHDFHHLPLLRGTTFLQSALVALVLLALPILLGLGPLGAAAVALAAAWLYLGLAERVVASCAVLALVALPWAAEGVARRTAWTGTLAERVDEIERGAPTDDEVRGLAARGTPPAALLAAAGRHFKRRGDLDEALRYYALAAAADARAAEIQVNVGNVLFLKGDIEGAKAAYLGATDRAGADLVVLGAAHYDLSKLYLRTSDMEKSAAAREKAEREAGDFLRRNGSDDDFSANRYLVDVPVPEEKILALTGADGIPEAVAAWVRRRVAGNVPVHAWPWAGLAAVAFLWAFGLSRGKLRPSGACEKCGRPACRRCGGSAELCGQCVNVYERRGVVDARDRLRKEEAVRRHHRLATHAVRVLSVVTGGAGQIWDGAPVRGALILLAILFSGFVVWFWGGIMPPPQPSQYVFLAKLAVAAPLGIAIWAFGIRDAFRRTS